VGDLARRIHGFSPRKHETPRLAVLHASNHRTSNTAALWKKIRERLGDEFQVTEVGLRNGTLVDCSGCPYTMCLHFGEQGGCFYGGVMVEEVYPAIREADAVVLLCPNYNDALSANLTAFINRLTALFRQMRFYHKPLFGIVVSGYSGGDIVARQLLGAMNMNKSFHLPGRFALMETANDPGDALALPGIHARLDAFADNIIKTLCKNG
jgi:multimeric flavodoxin WrbA